MPRDELRRLVLERLLADEVPTAHAETLADRVVHAATERLVLLVPQRENDVGFEVRSLQEFMAARALTNAAEQVVLDRLQALAPSAHWRNTWLLAAGQIAAQRQHLTDPLITLLRSMDAQDDLAMQLAPGAELAADLLDDGFGAPSPRVERLLVKHAAEALSRPLDFTTYQMAPILQRVAAGGLSSASRVLREAASQALSADPPQQISATVMLHLWAGGAGALATLGQQKAPSLERALGPLHSAALRAHFLGLGGTSAPPSTQRRGTLASCLPPQADNFDADDQAAFDALRAELNHVAVHRFVHDPSADAGDGTQAASRDEAADDEPDGRILENGDLWRHVAVVPRVHAPEPNTLEAALHRPAVAEHVALALLNLAPHDWAVASALTTVIRQWFTRRAVGAALIRDRP